MSPPQQKEEEQQQQLIAFHDLTGFAPGRKKSSVKVAKFFFFLLQHLSLQTAPSPLLSCSLPSPLFFLLLFSFLFFWERKKSSFLFLPPFFRSFDEMRLLGPERGVGGGGERGGGGGGGRRKG